MARFHSDNPIAGRPLPVVSADNAWAIRRSVVKTDVLLASLADSGVLQRILCGYALETMGKPSEAVKFYKAVLAIPEGPFIGRRAEFLKCKISELLRASGDLPAARELLHQIDMSADLRPPEGRFIRLAVSLGELEIARRIVGQLDDAEKKAIQEPLLHMLLKPDSNLLLKELPAVQEACSKWRPYQKLSNEAQDSWCSAAVHQRSSEQLAEIRTAWERHSVVEYALAVEIELRRVLQEFRTAYQMRLKEWSLDPAMNVHFSKLAAWFGNNGFMSLGEITTTLRRATSGNGIQPEAVRKLLTFSPSIMQHCFSVRFWGAWMNCGRPAMRVATLAQLI